jgi:Ca2+-binding EF-hand superfamily protein
MKKFSLLCTFVMITAVSAAAQSETLTTKTYVEQKERPGVNQIDFTVFDTNEDGQYSMEEVGARLFESFDRNNDDLIDNIEWDKNYVLTISPIEKETFKFYDLNDDGLTDVSTYSYDTFYRASGLIRFDDNTDGLSAKDFIEQPFLEVDKDNNGTIRLKEWTDVYLSTRMKHEEAESYN